MNKIKSIMCLCMALTIILGSTITASASEETETVGQGDNYVKIIATSTQENTDQKMIYEFVFNPNGSEAELCAIRSEAGDGKGNVVGEMYTFHVVNWENGQFEGGYDFANKCPYYKCITTNWLGNTFEQDITYAWKWQKGYDVTFQVVSGSLKVFESSEDAKQYGIDKTGEYEVISQPEMNKDFYFKNVGYSVRAEDSSEYPDMTFITFTWDTDNLKAGDMLEIKTRNHYTKIGGDTVIGFHDYITASKGIDCSSGTYEMSQTDAVKAWFETVDNKPLVFKDYDTDVYYLRPVRGNQQGMWVKVTMGRVTPTSSPFVSDIEYGEMTESGDWVVNEDVTISQGGNHGIDQGGNVISGSEVSEIVQLETVGDWIKYLFNCVNELFGYFADLPLMINTVAGWLPNPIITIICGSIVVIIILRVFGR